MSQEAPTLSDIPAESNSEEENDDDNDDDKSVTDDVIQADMLESQAPSDEKGEY